MSYAAGDANGNDLLVFLNGTSLHFYIDGVGTTHSAMDYSTLADGEKHSLAVSWDNTIGYYAIHVDGEFVESGTGKSTGVTLAGTTGTGAIVFGQEQETIGGLFESTQVFDGALYDCLLYTSPSPRDS